MRFFVLPLLLLLTACAGNEDKPPMQANTTIDVTRQTDGTYKATGPACPKWDDATIDRLANDPLPQLGCTTANNLAKQIADPADLVRAQTKSDKAVKASGEATARSVKKYRGGALTIAPTTPSPSAASPGMQQ